METADSSQVGEAWTIESILEAVVQHAYREYMTPVAAGTPAPLAEHRASFDAWLRMCAPDLAREKATAAKLSPELVEEAVRQAQGAWVVSGGVAADPKDQIIKSLQWENASLRSKLDRITRIVEEE